MKCCIFLLVLAAATASAWSDDQRQPRMLGNTAVMHVYYYAPKTLEVTFVDSFLFKDEQSCKEAIPKALMIATPYASEGDLVSASCIGMNPPEAIRHPRREPAQGTTEL
jgi:hypothetical protein